MSSQTVLTALATIAAILSGCGGKETETQRHGSSAATATAPDQARPAGRDSAPAAPATTPQRSGRGTQDQPTGNDTVLGERGLMLTVNTNVVPDRITADRRVRLNAVLAQSSADPAPLGQILPAQPLPRPNLAVRVLNAGGETLWQRLIGGTALPVTADLDFLLDPSKVKDGALTLEIAAEGLAPWRRTFHLDTTPPSLAVDARLGPPTDAGERTLGLTVTIGNKASGRCDDAELRLPGAASPVKIPLSVVSRSGIDGLAFAAKALGVRLAGVTDRPMLAIHCQDSVGNRTDLIQPLTTELRSLAFAAGVVGRTAAAGRHANDQDHRIFMPPGPLTLALSLLDPSTAAPLSAAAATAEAPALRTVITTREPRDASDLKGGPHVLWSQPFSGQLELPLPPRLVGAATLFASLLRHDVQSGRDELIGTTALPIFVADRAPALNWVAKPRFQAAGPDDAVQTEARLELSGAPLAGPITVEASQDGVNWSTVNPDALDQSVLSPSMLNLRLRLAPPFGAEAPFRLRLKAVDLAGQESFSPPSPTLFGRLGANVTVDPRERQGCLADGRPGARFAAFLASAFACKKAGSRGLLQGPSFAQVVLQNRGAALPVFFAPPNQSPGLGYQVLVDGTRVADGRLDPIADLQLAPADLRLLNFELLPEWLTGRHLEIRFDAEPTDAHSTINGCYQRSAPFPNLVLVDRDNGLNLTDSPFACEDEQNLAVP